MGQALALAGEGGAPEWVQLLPKGPRLTGRDGRAWVLGDPTRLASNSKLPIVIDYEHGQDLRAPKGEEAPAAGWIEALEARAGGEVWGRVGWTPRAAVAIAAREYRFISPTFTYRTDSHEVLDLVGAALVNRPNFTMAALNAQEQTMLKDIFEALGLPGAAAPADAVTAIHALKADKATALNAASTPSLERFVPRADYEIALNRANAAEAKIAGAEKQAHADKAAAAIEKAVKDGKIAPASKDYHIATCATADGLKLFETYVEGVKSMFDGSGLEKKEASGDATALNAEQRSVATALGISEKDFLAGLSKAA